MRRARHADAIDSMVTLMIVYLIGQRKLAENMENSGLVG